jgi:hypothetical protein
MKFATFFKNNGLVILVTIAILAVIVLMIVSGRSSSAMPRGPSAGGLIGPAMMAPSWSTMLPTYKPYTTDSFAPAPMETPRAKDTAKDMLKDAREAKTEATGVVRKVNEAETASVLGADLVDVATRAKDIEIKAGMVEKKAKDVERGARGVAYETIDDDVARNAFKVESDSKAIKAEASSLKNEARTLAQTPEALADPKKIEDLKQKASDLKYRTGDLKDQAKSVAKCVCPSEIDTDSGSESDSSVMMTKGPRGAMSPASESMHVKGFRGFQVQEKIYADPKADYLLL